MEGLARRVMVVAVVVLMVMGWQTCAVARLITVGGSHGWNQNVNYTEWSTDHQHLHVGDWLCNLPLIIFFNFLPSVFLLSHAFGLLPGFYVLIISAIFAISFLDYIYISQGKETMISVNLIADPGRKDGVAIRMGSTNYILKYFS